MQIFSRLRTSKKLEKLLKKAAMFEMNPEEYREQMISFAYGNAKLSNPNITREMVEEVYEKLYGKKAR